MAKRKQAREPVGFAEWWEPYADKDEIAKYRLWVMKAYGDGFAAGCAAGTELGINVTVDTAKKMLDGVREGMLAKLTETMPPEPLDD